MLLLEITAITIPNVGLILKEQEKSLIFLGCFIVEDNLLKVQTYNSIKNISKFEVEERWFTIQNDTILHYFKRIFKGDHFPKNEIYILKPCENKPDSRNVLM